MKKQNTRKHNVFVSLVMLLVTAVALTTASYAWFTANIAVTLTGLEINVEAAEGIQISTDAVTWRAQIDISDVIDPGENYGEAVNQVPSILTPVSTIGVVDDEEPGAFNFFDGELNEGETTTLDTTAAAAEVHSTTEGNYVAFDLFIRSATEEDIWLGENSVVEYVPAVEEESAGLEYAMRVGFLYQGTDDTYTPATAQALAAGTSADQIIWEPNAREYTAHGIARGATPGQVETYYGVKAAGEELEYDNPDWEAIGEDPWEGPGETPGFAGYFEQVTTITPDSDGEPFEQILGNVLFTVDAGITKIRVYVWVEGQDIDSDNAISLGEGDIAITLQFVMEDEEE